MKRIDINDIFDDNDITLFTMMSSYARVFRRYTNKKEYETACEYMNAIIDYAVSIENEGSFVPNFKTEDLISAWLASRPNIKKSAIEYSSGRRGQEKKKAKNSISEGSRKTPLNKGDINPIKGDIYPLKSKEEEKIKEEREKKSIKKEAEAPAPNPFEDEDLLEKANHASDVTLFEDGQPTAETFDTSPPKSKGEILDYMQSKGHALEHLNVERFWNYYSQRGWRSKTGVPVIWRQKVDEWVVDDQREKIAELEERRRAGGS